MGERYRIHYYPKSILVNSYPDRFQEVLKEFGELQYYDSFKSHLKDLLKNGFYQKDIIFVNWLENWLFREGENFRLRDLFLFLGLFYVIRLSYKKVIWVHHNHYPHHAPKKYRYFAQSIITIIESFCNGVIIHVPDTKKDFTYVPHPLFKKISLANVTFASPFETGHYFVLFGRIIPYKEIEQVIESFPHNENLMIFGQCRDSSYLASLRDLIGSRANIHLRGDLLSEEEAQFLVQRSKGMIVGHVGEGFLLSGSIMYGLSMEVPVYTIANKVTCWLKTLAYDKLFVFDDLQSLMCHLSVVPDCKNFSSIANHFSDMKIKNILRRFF